ncbi:unnamed protein product [Allacma fusca]|uniref:Uncharacterized protein n=1 Tax=Allacma fusca TaxID=39272 RepID=A0A8J2PSA5_9HEXA|nr:unnamed protein product [Allacma fusca]
MVVNGIVPLCMVLELVLIVVKNTSKLWEHYSLGTFIGGVDAVFTLVIPLYLFASVLWLLYFRSHYGFITKVRMMRMYQGGILSVVGQPCSGQPSTLEHLAKNVIPPMNPNIVRAMSYERLQG